MVMADTILDIMRIISATNPYPGYTFVIPLLSSWIRWTKFLDVSSGTYDKAYVQNDDLYMYYAKKMFRSANDYLVAREGTFYADHDLRTGYTGSFSVDLELDFYLHWVEWDYWGNPIYQSQKIEQCDISHADIPVWFKV